MFIFFKYLVSLRLENRPYASAMDVSGRIYLFEVLSDIAKMSGL